MGPKKQVTSLVHCPAELIVLSLVPDPILVEVWSFNEWLVGRIANGYKKLYCSVSLRRETSPQGLQKNRIPLNRRTTKTLTAKSSYTIGKSSIILLVALAVAGCGGGGSSSDVSAPTRSTSVDAKSEPRADDLEHYALDVLSTDDRFPDDFYSEPNQTGQLRTIYHLKSTDVAAPAANGTGKFDLCTDDVNQGIGWVTTHYADLEGATLVDTGETERYYDASWEIASTPVSYRDVRVFKCSFADRSVYDWDQPNSALARIDSEADSARLKAVADYLWYFSPNNNYGNAVLATETSELADRPVYTMTKLYSQLNWDGQCNSAIITEARYSVDPVSGILSVERSVVDGFLWRLGDNGAEFCV